MKEALALRGIALRAPGISSWAQAIEVFQGQSTLEPSPLSNPTGTGLPPAERRRATWITRLALDVAREALSDQPLCEPTSIFASSGGEVDIVNQMFTQLASEDRRLSPTAFHNSVHNAAAGHFSIASGSMAPAESLCAFDESFGTGLMEVLLRAQNGEDHLLLVAYDAPPPFPLSEVRPIRYPFALALYFAKGSARPLATLTGRYAPGHPQTRPLDLPFLNQLAQDNPAAKSLPLLSCIARQEDRTLEIAAGLGGHLKLAGIPRPLALHPARFKSRWSGSPLKPKEQFTRFAFRPKKAWRSKGGL